MIRRIGVVVGVLTLVVLAMAAPAWAHVTVAPESAPRGASDVEVGFRVPNEEAKATTTKVEIFLPSSPPILNVLAEAVPGWTPTVVTTHLAKPISTDDGDVSDVVSQITWASDTPASAIKPGEFQKFEILVGSLPDTGDQIVFKALQTYSDGTVVQWVDPVTPGGPAAEHPTPILELTSPEKTPSQATTPTTTATGSATELPSDVATKSDTDTAKTIAIVAVVFAALALIGVVISMIRRRPATK